VIVLVCLESPCPGQGARAAETLARKLAGVAETVAITVGGPTDSESLTWALERRSFRRIIHLDEASLDRADFMTVGMVLAEVARHLDARVVIAGEHSDLEGQGLVPAALAHLLRAPLIARVQDLRLPSPESQQLEITVPAGGRLCTFACPLPIVLTAITALDGEAVPLDLTGAASAVEVMTLVQLTLDSSRLVPRPELLGAHVPSPSSAPRRVTPDEAARFLLRRQ